MLRCQLRALTFSPWNCPPRATESIPGKRALVSSI